MASKENHIAHKPLHSVNSLEHNLITLGLSGAVQVALVGDHVVGLGEVGVAEGVGHAVVEPLDGLVRLLTQILEANAKCFCSILWCMGLQKLGFQIVPIIVKSRFGKVSQMIYFLSIYFKLFTSLIDKY